MLLLFTLKNHTTTLHSGIMLKHASFTTIQQYLIAKVQKYFDNRLFKADFLLIINQLTIILSCL